MAAFDPQVLRAGIGPAGMARKAATGDDAMHEALLAWIDDLTPQEAKRAVEGLALLVGVATARDHAVEAFLEAMGGDLAAREPGS